jgi:hypothetical protein
VPAKCATQTTITQVDSCIVLDDLARAVRIEHGAVVADFGSGLGHAMNVGDLLTKAKDLVGYGRWTTWLSEYCSLSARQANNYMALARTRSAVEAKIGTAGAELSIKAALRAIGRKPGTSSNPCSVPALNSASWRAASPEEQRIFVLAVGVDEILAALPEQSREAAKPLSKEHLSAICGSLKLALGATNDNEALAALRAVNRVLAAAGRDYHNLIAALERRGGKRH